MDYGFVFKHSKYGSYPVMMSLSDTENVATKKHKEVLLDRFDM